MQRRTPIGLGLFALAAVLLLFLVFRQSGPGSTAANPEPGDRAAQTPSADTNRAPPRTPFRRISAPAAASRDAASIHGAIAGVVLDWDTQSPVPQAEVTFMNEDGAHSVVSNAKGRFELDAPAEGSYALGSVLAEGYEPWAPALGQSPVQFTARPGTTVDGVVIYLVPSLTLQGSVVDTAGAPVAGAEVRTLGVGTGETALADIEATYIADAQGRFELSAPLGTRVEATYPEAGAGRAVVDERALASRAVTIQLDPEVAAGDAAMAGVVVDPDGRPLPGARVVAGPSALSPVAETVTDEAGGFLLEDLVPGAYRVEASHVEYAPVWTPLMPTGSMSIRIHLVPGGTIEGTIRDEADEAVAGATVVALRHSGALLRVQQAVVTVFDAEGSYRIAGLPPGLYDVVGAAHDHAQDKKVAVEVDASAVQVDLRLPTGARITGRVVDEDTGRPIAAARVEVERAVGRGPSVLPMFASSLTGADGQFVLQGIEAGRHSVVAYARDHLPRVVSGIQVGPDDAGPITIALSPGQDDGQGYDIVGIGVEVSTTESDLRVNRTLPGGGADRAGVLAGDRIVAVDGLPVAEYDFAEAVQALRGAEGTRVLLTVSRGDDVFDVEATRYRVRG